MKKREWLAIGIAVLALLAAWLVWGNTALERTDITVTDPEIPTAFDDFRIAQVSDLHNAEFGEENRKLLALLRSAQPDIIVITGDLIDSRHEDVSAALEFMRQAVKIAPCYFATGNHESASAAYPQLEADMELAGVTVLHNEAVVLEREGESLCLVGVDDYSFFGPGSGEACIAAMLAKLEPELEPGYNILLYHRPELADRLAELDVDLVLSGHAHGGQIRLPFLGGLYAPDQGFFPAYDSGLYELEGMQMVVSRGLGNSQLPLRINNRPQVVLVTLKCESCSE